MPDETDAGATLERAFRREHRCRRGCPGCASARRSMVSPTLSSRFGALIEGEAGLRFAQARAESGQPFPPFSDEPYEQWLVEEALLLRYRLEVGLERQNEQARADAAEQAQQLLGEHLSARGGVGA
jgi:hypothetical protein